MITAARRQEMRDALNFTKPRLQRGYRPFAAPSAALNDLGTRIESTFANISKDGPRRLNEGDVPYWSTLPNDPLCHPIVESASGGRAMRLLANLPQCLANTGIGICALAMALYYAVRLKRNCAQIVLGAHAIHVAQAVVTVGVPLTLAIFCLI